MVKLKYIGLKLRDPKTRGAFVLVDFYESGRGGTKSPLFWCYKYNGRFITPFERRVRGWDDPSMVQWLKIIYDSVDSPNIRDLLYERNPFLELIPKGEFVGSLYPIPIIKY